MSGSGLHVIGEASGKGRDKRDWKAGAADRDKAQIEKRRLAIRYYQFVDAYEALAKSAWNWRIAAFAFAVIAIGELLVIAATRVTSEAVPFLVETDSLGSLRYYQVLQAEDKRHSETLERHLVASAIQNLRMRSMDPEAQRILLERGMAYLEGAALGWAQEMIRKENPMKRRASSVSVDIVSAIPIGEKSWDVRWREKEYGSGSGSETASRERFWRGVVTVERRNTRVVGAITDNPFGLYITGLSFNLLEERQPVSGSGPDRAGMTTTEEGGLQ